MHEIIQWSHIAVPAVLSGQHVFHILIVDGYEGTMVGHISIFNMLIVLVLTCLVGILELLLWHGISLLFIIVLLLLSLSID